LSPRTQVKAGRRHDRPQIEVVFLPGLADVVYDELTARFPQTRDWAMVPGREDAAAGTFSGPLSALLSLRTIVAPFLVLTFPVPGPAGLLGAGSLAAIGEAMRVTRGLDREPGPDSFRIEAAGRESPTMRDLAHRLAGASGLREAEDGECVVRIRPNPERRGWDALVRLSALPLSARPWRVRGYQAAVNATVAAAMARLVEPRPADRVANLMCGSGTLLIERLLAGPAGVAVGVDVAGEAIEAARENLAAAGLDGRARLLEGDIRDEAWGAAGPFDCLLADPPWGDKSGRHSENERLHRTLLERAHAHAAPDARLAVLTHEIKIMERCLDGAGDLWRPVSETSVFQKGHHPRIYVLRRR
jgi:predicted RNA methylase